ncbi:MAG: alkaline phosphatase family protein, partial [Acidobacteriota bacterium]
MTTRPRLLARLVVGAALAVLFTSWRPLGARPPAAPDRPTLLVLVVVDQMRAEYLTRYSATWTGGLRRLIDEGAHYENAAYPYLNTVTCVGHATLGTGAWPKTHGIILNQWFRRDLNAVRSCTWDPAARTIVYGGRAEAEGHSAGQLRVPTLAERLRARWPESRAVTVSLKPRSAIMMAGKGATAVTWIGAGGWQSSTAFTPTPLPSVARAAALHALDLDRDAVWQRLRDPASYQGVDDAPGERPQFGWTRTFPHPLNASGTAAGLLENWESSPYGDAALGAMAVAAIDDFKLGQRGVADFLGVSYSSTDLVGHDFGPDSHEVQDTLARLDGTLGALLAALDAKVGRHHYALVLSADHGVATVPEMNAARGVPAGRVALGLVRDA